MAKKAGREVPIKMPDLRLGSSVAQMPGEQLEFYFRFEGDWEEEIQIFKASDGSLLPTGKINNYFGDVRQYVVPVNAGPKDSPSIIYGIFAYHKKSAPDHKKDWYFSEARILDSGKSLLVVGFDDQYGDKNYQDAVVEVRMRELQ